jgi:hypothetical protein
VKVSGQAGRWTLLYRGRNRHGKTVWLGRCRCLTIRELYAADLAPRRKGWPSWTCGHQSTRTPRPKIGKTSRFRGVSNDLARSLPRPWRVALFVDGVHCYVGRFATEVEAARAYDRAAIELLGPTAILNFPQDKEG